MNDIHRRADAPDVSPPTPPPPPRRSGPSPIGAAVVLLMLGALAAAGYWYVALRPGGGQPAGPGAPADFKMPVEAMPVRVGPVVVEVRAVGSLMSNESVLIAPEIAGRVSALPIEEGVWIEAGTPVAELDSEVYRAELAQAEANLVLSEQNQRRAEDLVKQGAGTQRALDEANAALANDRARVELARARLAKTRLAAPFGGVLGMRRVSLGAYVDAGDPIINLEQIDPLKLEFRVPEAALAAVAPGRPVALRVDAVPGRTFTGAIYAIDPLIDESGRSIAVRARVPNPDGALRPGLFARVSVIVERREHALLVPERAIVPIGEETFVFRVVEDVATMTKVRLGKRQDGEVEVVEGLGEADVIITDGLLKIGDGMPVAVVPPPS
jgi:membrane fusion protein (multidrug efflux system)